MYGYYSNGARYNFQTWKRTDVEYLPIYKVVLWANETTVLSNGAVSTVELFMQDHSYPSNLFVKFYYETTTDSII